MPASGYAFTAKLFYIWLLMKLFFTPALSPYQPDTAAAFGFTQYVNPDDKALLGMLSENLSGDEQFNSDITAELGNFLRFTASMLGAFPVGLYMRRRIRKNKRLNYILQFPELQAVRNNIEKGSFAYDTLLFRQSPLQLFNNKSHLANLVCLAILFGDEFIDGIAAEHGKKNIQAILNDGNIHYYLQCRKTGNGFELFYEFDICEVLPPQVLDAVNAKYGITYKAFYAHLRFLLSEMNVYLNKLDNEKASEAALLICKACNKCFDTYKADINGLDEGYSFTDLLQYQKTKDDDIIQVLLTLRAVLLGKKQLHFQKQFSSWSSMVRSMQLYDDMQDVATDCDFQMNTLCYFARNYFPEEWHWLQYNKTALAEMNGMALHAVVSLYMPASCMLTLQYARNIAHTKLSWVQRKIQNYLWRKNWLGFGNELLRKDSFCLSVIMNKKEYNIPLKLHFIQKQVMQTDSPWISDDMKWGYLLDVILLDDELKSLLFKKISRRDKYFLTSCYLEFPLARKAMLARQFFNTL